MKVLVVLTLSLHGTPDAARLNRRAVSQQQRQQQQQQQQQLLQQSPGLIDGGGVGQVLPADPLEDCFEVPQSLCLQGDAGRSFVLSPKRVLPDLALWYQFDKSLPVDESGHWRHLTDPTFALSPLAVGPGILGHGSSAAFDGQAYRVVRSNEALETQSFTVALWLYLLQDSVGSWRTIFSKGADAEQLLPALLLWPDERRLHVRAAPRADISAGTLDAVGLMPLRRWTHIAVSCTGSVLRLYINGVKDGETILQEPPAGGGGDLYLGRDPWRAGTKAYLDDFRWYSRELSSSEIRALIFPSLTGMGADFVQLGCSSCAYSVAATGCESRRAHLCSLQELFAGGFHTARAMGWLAASPEVWYHGEVGLGAETSGQQKLGLCCTD